MTLDFGSGDFTAEFWTKHTSGAGANQRLISQAKRWFGGLRYTNDYNLNDIEFVIDDGTNQVSVSTTGNALPDDGKPHHYAIVVDRTADTVTWYVDSVAQTPVTIALVTGSISNASNFDMFATSEQTAPHEAGGILDDVRFWSDKRTAQEIADNYQVELDMTQTQAGLVGYWKHERCYVAVLGGGVTENDATSRARMT